MDAIYCFLKNRNMVILQKTRYQTSTRLGIAKLVLYVQVLQLYKASHKPHSNSHSKYMQVTIVEKGVGCSSHEAVAISKILTYNSNPGRNTAN
jgi:hypothetical protein